MVKAVSKQCNQGKPMSNHFISTEEAIREIAEGRMLILVDDEDRENEGDLIVAADKITLEMINFMSKEARGIVCLTLADHIVQQLGIPMMCEQNQSKYSTPFTVSIEAAEGVTTGVSISDRYRTIKAATHPDAKPSDLIMPGHIFPLRARWGGVLERAGHTEGSVDLARLAGFREAAVICEILNDDGTMARLPDLKTFALKHNIKIAAINELITYRMKSECLLTTVSESRLPLDPYGEFTIKVFENKIDQKQHVALIKGDIDSEAPVLVRVHSECLTGDVFGSARCDCGEQLQTALKQISEQGGVLVYLRQEGRGIGLANKIQAYGLQDKGLDTVEANQHLGFKADHRDYGIGSQMLSHLGVKKIRILTNNPRKIYGVEGYGLEIVSRESLEITPKEENKKYLQTKRDKLGHLLSV